jgi:amino acid permease
MKSFEQQFKTEFESLPLGGMQESAKGSLHNIRKHNVKIFWLFFTIVAILLLLTVVLVWYYVDSPNELAIAFGTAGLSFWKPLDFLLRSWESWRKSELLLLVIDGASDSELGRIREKIVEGYYTT